MALAILLLRLGTQTELLRFLNLFICAGRAVLVNPLPPPPKSGGPTRELDVAPASRGPRGRAAAVAVLRRRLPAFELVHGA
jgi:hypothetical protein